MKRFAIVFAFAVTFVLLTLIPAVSQTPGQTKKGEPVVQFQSPKPGRAEEDVPMARFRPANNKPYQLTTDEKRQIVAKIDQLGTMIRSLKAKRVDDALLADVEIYHSAANW